MKSTGALALTFALAIGSAAGPAGANPAERGAASGNSMSGMMNRQGMMGGMHSRDASFGREQPLLSLALQNRAELALSPEQENTLRMLVDRFAKEAPQRTRDLEAAEHELAGLLKQEPADPAQVDDKVRAIEKLRADFRLRRIHTIAEGRAALAPEQRAKLEQLAATKGRSAPSEGPRGAEEMQRFMSSERMPQAMDAMMAMAERMGGGDTMLGMVRMMEMMSMMGGGGMMGGQPPREESR